MANGQGLDAKRLNGQGLDAQRYSRELQNRIGGFRDNAAKMIEFARRAKNLATAPEKTASSNNPYNDAVSNWGSDNPWGFQQTIENNGGKSLSLSDDIYNDMPGYQPTFDESRAMAAAGVSANDLYDSEARGGRSNRQAPDIGFSEYGAVTTDWNPGTPGTLDIDFQDPQAMQAADADSNLLINRYMDKRVDDISSFLNNAMDNYRARKEALENQAREQRLGNNNAVMRTSDRSGGFSGNNEYQQNRNNNKGGGFSAGGKFSGKAFGR